MKSNKQVNYELYLVSDRDVLKGRDFIYSLEEAIQGGVTVIQLREKNSSSLEFYTLALMVKDLTTKYNIPLIINDRLDIALAIDADGLHIGQSDLPAKIVRQILGKDKILGVSTATLEEAHKSIEDGADYIGVGALFPTDTKSDTRSVSLDQLRFIKENVNVPVVGIGGINENNIKSVFDTGLDGVAIVSAILGKPNIKAAASSLKDLIK